MTDHTIVTGGDAGGIRGVETATARATGSQAQPAGLQALPNRSPAREARHEAFEVVPGVPGSGIVVLADHATNIVPEGYPPALGLPPDEFERHIAYDIGVEGIARGLAERLGAPLVMSRFSRLVIDPNRGEDDPTLVMQLSDGAIVPGNHRLDEAERRRRVARFWRPYDDAVTTVIEGALAEGIVPLVVSLHSFTARWRGVPRPWEVGILWDADDRAARALIEGLSVDPALTVGDNEPYDGALGGDMMNRQAHARGLPHALIEVRQDLIADRGGQREWVDRLAPLLARLDASPGMHEVRHYLSRTDAALRPAPIAGPGPAANETLRSDAMRGGRT